MIYFKYIKVDKINNVKDIKNWLKNVVLEEKKEIGEIVFIFCNDDYLLKKNIKYLNHNTFTDVISFDYSDKNITSGDIFISTERVKENAIKYNVEFLKELHMVMVHGLLHLLKYNDKNQSDKKLMNNKENYYLKKRWN